MRRRLDIAWCLLAGAWLGLLQVRLFLELQMLLSSAFATYVTVLLGWLAGAALGVWITRPVGPFLIVLGALAPQAAGWLLAAHPHDTAWLPGYGLILVLAGLFGGHLFQQERTTFPTLGELFFWENTGFALGLAGSVLAAMLGGRASLAFLPGAGGLALAAWTALRLSRWPRGSASP